MFGGHNHAERRPSDSLALSLEHSVIEPAVLCFGPEGFILEESDKRAAHPPSES